MNVVELIKEKLEEETDCPNCSMYCADANICGFDEMRKQAISIVDEVAQEYNNGWIPCKKELPQITNSYLVTKKCEDDGKPIYETSHEIFWLKDNKWDCERDEDCEWEVTAWQNKLAPYKEGGTE